MRMWPEGESWKREGKVKEVLREKAFTWGLNMTKNTARANAHQHAVEEPAKPLS